MGRSIRGGESCAIARTVDVFKDPWSFLILREAFDGVTRFADFRARLGIASDVLTERLNALVQAGVLQRERYQDEGSRARVGYVLTGAGDELAVVIGAIQQWGDTHLPVDCGPTIERRHRSTGGPIGVGFVDAKGCQVKQRDVVFERTAAYPA